MPFIGKQPQAGAYSKLDAITTSATATYNLTLDSGAYYPQSANHLLVSLNGVIQAPQDSFTVSGSQIIFDSALTSADVIDFIIALGDTLDIGVPSAGSVNTSQLANDAVTTAKIAAGAVDTTELASGAVTSAKLDTNIAVAGDLTVDTNTFHVDATNNRIGVGLTDPAVQLHVKNSSGNSESILGQYGTGTRALIGAYANQVELRAYNGTNDYMTFKIDSTVKARIDSDGLKFGSDSAAANALDDYEEGTWTPTVTDLNGTEVSGYSAQIGHYTKIGNMVYAVFRLQVTNKGSITGSYTHIRGLPFNHAGSDGGSGIINRYQNLNNAVSGLSIELGGGTPTSAWFTKVSGTSGTSDTYLQTADVSNTFFAQGILIYRTS